MTAHSIRTLTSNSQNAECTYAELGISISMVTLNVVMPVVISLNIVILTVVFLSFYDQHTHSQHNQKCYSQYHNAECQYAECHGVIKTAQLLLMLTECGVSIIIMLSRVLLGVVVLSVTRLNVAM
jgi:hypothetical protein